MKTEIHSTQILGKRGVSQQYRSQLKKIMCISKPSKYGK